MLASAGDSPGTASHTTITGVASVDEAEVQARVVAALKASLGATLIETHISFVLLTGTLAYKIKKAIDLRFLNFRTLAARRFYCEEELRLNRRLAPAIYLDVVPVTGTTDAPRLGGDGTILDYAVRMREFAQDSLATRALAQGRFSERHIDALAMQIATFHREAARAPAGGALGTPQAILRLALDNFAELGPLLEDPPDVADLESLEAWTREEHARCAAAMSRRHREGCVRECHGDLHLGNIAVVEDAPLAFDGIEFNDEMRWIDVMSEIAFTTMDLHDRGRPDLAHRFLNAYVEIGGDYDGLGVLRFHLVYRAVVRAKVACLRAAQMPPSEARAALLADIRRHLTLAKAFARPATPAVVITHGLAGSGKTTCTQTLLEAIGAVRIRTDLERKRLHGLSPASRSAAGIDAGLYTSAATRDTYRRVLGLARSATDAGYVTIVDGAFLKRWQRGMFRALAAEAGIPFVIIGFDADEATLRERIARRLQEAKDASDADIEVLEHQLSTQEPLTPAERAHAVVFDAGRRPDETPPELWNEVRSRLRGTPGAAPATAGSHDRHRSAS